MKQNEPRFDVPLLVEQFRNGPPRRDSRDVRSPLTAEEREYLLYRWLRGVSAARSAREIRIEAATMLTVQTMNYLHGGRHRLAL